MIELTHGRVALALHPLRAGEGLPLLALHALGSSSAEWNADDVGLRDWPGPIFALDFSGHGYSGRVRGGVYSAELYAADADLALEHLAQAAIVGRGLGAYVALLLGGARNESVHGSLLVPGEGIEGGGEAPDWDSDPKSAPARSYGAVEAGLQKAPSPDPSAMSVGRDLRPSDYARAFAEEQRRLYFLDEPRPQTSWWQDVTDRGFGERVTSLGAGIEALARDRD